MTFDRFINNVHGVAFWLMWLELALAIIWAWDASGKRNGSNEYRKAMMLTTKAIRGVAIFAITWLVTR